MLITVETIAASAGLVSMFATKGNAIFSCLSGNLVNTDNDE